MTAVVVSSGCLNAVRANVAVARGTRRPRQTMARGFLLRRPEEPNPPTVAGIVSIILSSSGSTRARGRYCSFRCVSSCASARNRTLKLYVTESHEISKRFFSIYDLGLGWERVDRTTFWENVRQNQSPRITLVRPLINVSTWYKKRRHRTRKRGGHFRSSVGFVNVPQYPHPSTIVAWKE